METLKKNFVQAEAILQILYQNFNSNDSPIITQFAANTVHDFVGAAYMVSPYCDGVDLNCGCPQRWARQMGLGCVLLENPEVIADIVKQCRNQICKPFTVSVKTRVLKNARKSVEICQQLEKAGASFLAVHGRTPAESTGDVDKETLRLIVENVKCPIVANGGVKTLDDCYKMQEETKCNGVMVANALLTNPTLVKGTESTTLECVQKWIDICYNSTLTVEEYNTKFRSLDCDHTIQERPRNLIFQCFHHHLVFMMEKILPRRKRRVFNNFQTFKQVLSFLRDEFGMEPKLFDLDNFKKNNIIGLDFQDKNNVYNFLINEADKEKNFDNINGYNYDETEGKYFRSKVKNEDDNEDNFMNMFIEDD